MAYPSSFLRLVMSGPLYTLERWSMSLSLMRDFAPTAEAPTEVPQGVITAVETFIGSSIMDNAVQLDLIKLNEIGTDGRYVNQSETVLFDYTTPITATGNANIPPQTAIVATLRTAKARGLANSGRIFLPCPAFTPGVDGRITAANAVTIANQVTTFLSDLNAAMPEWRVCVASDVREGDFNAVTHVEVGRTYDTVRSRRTSLPEERQPATTPVGP